METSKKFLNFRKRNFLIFQERNIQNPDILRTKSILRTLVYSEPETYSEHCQIFPTERFAKIATLRTFLYSWK